MDKRHKRAQLNDNDHHPGLGPPSQQHVSSRLVYMSRTILPTLYARRYHHSDARRRYKVVALRVLSDKAICLASRRLR